MLRRKTNNKIEISFEQVRVYERKTDAAIFVSTNYINGGGGETIHKYLTNTSTKPKIIYVAVSLKLLQRVPEKKLPPV